MNSTRGEVGIGLVTTWHAGEDGRLQAISYHNERTGRMVVVRRAYSGDGFTVATTRGTTWRQKKASALALARRLAREGWYNGR